MKVTVALLLALSVPLTAGASPNPWPFDFDSNISPHKDYIDQRIAEEFSNLPGVPDSKLTEVDLGDIRLYFYPEMVDAFYRARDSGPGYAAELPRPAVMCQHHAGFTLPSLELQSGDAICSQTKSQIQAVFADHQTACQYVEYPELYVNEYESGPIPSPLNPDCPLTSFEGLISLCGEALMHVEFQENLFDPGLIIVVREVIAKLRYDSLLDAIAAQRTDYQQVLTDLQAAAHCFTSSDSAALTADIDAMNLELDAAQQWLLDLYADGLAQAAHDLAAVECQCRTREELLHPALSDYERLQLSFYIGGTYWRMRGAGLVAEPPDPDQGLTRRYYFVEFPYHLISLLNAGEVDGDNVGRDIFIQENWGYADWMDMGNSPGRDKYADLVDMTDRGRIATTMAAPRLNNRNYDTRDLVFGGLMMGPCYYYAWEELRTYQLGEDLQYPYMWFLECPTAIGEFCTGGTLALGLARTLLWGKPVSPCDGDCSHLDGGTGGDDGGMDAGGGDDAGIGGDDAGTGGDDAGAGGDDASTGDDAAGGNDAGGDDASIGSDDADTTDSGIAGDDGGTGSGGCGCGVTPPGQVFLALVALLALRRRKRNLSSP
jgi:MYXO-CTERM domain-containing protein